MPSALALFRLMEQLERVRLLHRQLGGVAPLNSASVCTMSASAFCALNAASLWSGQSVRRDGAGGNCRTKVLRRFIPITRSACRKIRRGSVTRRAPAAYWPALLRPGHWTPPTRSALPRLRTRSAASRGNVSLGCALHSTRCLIRWVCPSHVSQIGQGQRVSRLHMRALQVAVPVTRTPMRGMVLPALSAIWSGAAAHKPTTTRIA